MRMTRTFLYNTAYYTAYEYADHKGEIYYYFFIIFFFCFFQFFHTKYAYKIQDPSPAGGGRFLYESLYDTRDL